jgi:thiosulfate dehydrogenase
MKALLAYIQFLSTGVPVGKSPEGRGSPALALLARAADPNRGADLYQKNCALCHQPDGQGKRNGTAGDAKGYAYPPLWGPDSFNDGAGMHRLIASASFIRANMPFGTRYDAPALSAEDAWDVAAYINSQPRPHRDHLDTDYPNRARKPVDAPFPPFPDKFPLEQHRLGPSLPGSPSPNEPPDELGHHFCLTYFSPTSLGRAPSQRARSLFPRNVLNRLILPDRH